MKYCITFQNPGLLDLAAADTLGINVKDSNNPIGYFGTGLKFAIATLLRSNHKVEIYLGFEKHEFTTQAQTVRGKDFNIVHRSGKPLGFTTDLGKNWSLEHALRELESNVRDEDGRSFRELVSPKLDHTSIYVYGEPFYDAYDKVREIFLASTPFWKSEAIEFHHGETNHVYYRGVRAYTAATKFKHTYNILCKEELTEDRTLRSTHNIEYEIVRALTTEAVPSSALVEAITANKDFAEGHFTYYSVFKPSEQFIGAVAANVSHPNLNHEAFKRAASIEADIEIANCKEPNPEQDVMLAQAEHVCHSLGLTENFRIYVDPKMHPDMLGRAHSKKRLIFLAPHAFDQGQRRLTSTLLEEKMHLQLGVQDCTRSMQNWLLDKLIAIVDK